MKKGRIIWTGMIVIMIILAGCGSSDEEYVTTYQIAVQKGEEILNNIQGRDADSLKEMFCERTKKTYDLDKEIAQAFEFIDGEIISYDKPDKGSQSKSTTPQETTELSFGGHIDNIKTDTGKNYKIEFYYNHICAEDEEYVGIEFIDIIDEDTYDPETGYPDEGILWIGDVLED